MRLARSLLAACALSCAALASNAQAPFESWAPLGRYERIAFAEGGSLRIAIPTERGETEVAFVPQRVVAEAYSGEWLDRRGVRRGAAAPRVTTYTGRIARGRARDFAKLSHEGGRLRGLVRLDGVLYDLAADLAAGDRVLSVREVTPAEVAALARACGTPEPAALLAAATPPSGASAAAPSAAAATLLREVELGTEVDAPLVQQAGGASAANARVLGIVNMMNGIYESDLGITNRVVAQRAHVGSDPYTTTNPGTLLDQFISQFSANIATPYDDAMLFSGRDFDGATVGIAYERATCGRFRYAATQVRNQGDYLASLISAHEVGHNLGASHTTAGLMTASLDPAINTFSQFSKDQIASYVASVSCLATVSAPSNNQPPVLDPIGPQQVVEGQLLEVQLTATDPNGDALVFGVTPLPPGTSLSPSGLFAWRPARNAAGCAMTSDYLLQFRAVDPGGLTATETVPISVTDVPTNAPPLLLDPANRAAQVGQLVQVQLQATDDDGDSVTFSAASLPAGATLSPMGLFGWTPSASQLGSTTVAFQVQDCTGLTASQDVRIDVSAQTAPPAASKKKKSKCGLLGIESPLAVGLCVLLRGRRGRRAFRRLFGSTQQRE